MPGGFLRFFVAVRVLERKRKRRGGGVLVGMRTEDTDRGYGRCWAGDTTTVEATLYGFSKIRLIVL